ncbi:MAG: C40 family peptidase [Lachnospiraceae bacterium]|nr:C40 family peptidase [Lachnospiraceae bacterium]
MTAALAEEETEAVFLGGAADIFEDTILESGPALRLCGAAVELDEDFNAYEIIGEPLTEEEVLFEEEAATEVTAEEEAVPVQEQTEAVVVTEPCVEVSAPAEYAAAPEAEENAVAEAAAEEEAAGENEEPSVPAEAGGLGAQVVAFACNFVGNPYVYGGISLTDGADCSGFVLAVYQNFGVSLPHSSSADAGVGTAVEGGLAAALPGDLICYNGHVAIYMGDGQIVHAFNSRKGICITNADYDTILAIRRIF